MSDLFNKIQPIDYANKGIRTKTNPLNMQPAEAQRAFDELSLDVIIPIFNAAIDVLNSLNLGARVSSGDIKGIRINADNVIEVTTDGETWVPTGSESTAASADRAEAAQTAAEAAQSAAETAKAQAETAQTEAEAAKNTAVTAKNDAETAKAGAETAQTKAETAQSMAEAAQTAAETARSGAETAQSSAQSSANSAAKSSDTAGAKATEATNQALLSKSYAVGGTGARTGEETDNAKYYCEQAELASGKILVDDVTGKKYTFGIENGKLYYMEVTE